MQHKSQTLEKMNKKETTLVGLAHRVNNLTGATTSDTIRWSFIDVLFVTLSFYAKSEQFEEKLGLH